MANVTTPRTREALRQLVEQAEAHATKAKRYPGSAVVSDGAVRLASDLAALLASLPVPEGAVKSVLGRSYDRPDFHVEDDSLPVPEQEQPTHGNGACGRCGHLSSEHGLDRGGADWEGCYQCDCASFKMPRASLPVRPEQQDEEKDSLARGHTTGDPQSSRTASTDKGFSE